MSRLRRTIWLSVDETPAQGVLSGIGARMGLQPMGEDRVSPLGPMRQALVLTLDYISPYGV